MGEYLTPEEARIVELPRNPFARARRIRELAEPLGGLGIDLQSTTGVLGIPTRSRLVRQAWNVEWDTGARNFVDEHGITDLDFATTCYGLIRLDDILQAHTTDESNKFING